MTVISERPSLRAQMQRPAARALVGASVIATTGALPIFMLAALVSFVRIDMGLTEAQFGVAVSMFFGTAAVASTTVGFLTERMGGATTLILGAVLSTVSMVAIAAGRSWTWLILWLLVAGLGHVASQLGANHRLSHAVSPKRQGLAFGVRQSGPPAASLLGGLSVPWIAVALGWRPAMYLAAIVPLTVGLTQVRAMRAERSLPSRQQVRPRTITRRRLEARGQLTVFALATVFVTAPLTAMASFLVDYTVLRGLSPGSSGFLLSLASAVAIVVRILLGWWADRARVETLRVVAGMLATGSGAFLLLGHSSAAAGLIVAAILAYGIGWGWPGIFILGIIRRNPAAPAAATGIPQMGMFAGGALGPTAFGVLVARYGYDVAWDVTSGCMLVGAALLAAGTRIGATDQPIPSDNGAIAPK